MTDRIHVELTGPLPDESKFKRVGEAQDAIAAFVATWNKDHEDTPLTASVKLVRPNKKAAAIVQGTTLAPEPVVAPVELALKIRHHDPARVNAAE